MSDQDKARRGDAARGVVADVAAAGLGLVVGAAAGPLGPVVGPLAGAAAITPLRRLSELVSAELARDVERRQRRTIEAGADAAGVEPDVFVEWCNRDERTRLSTALALGATSRSTYPPKATLLGRALALSLQETEPALVDLSQQMIRILDALEAAHVEVLDFLRREPWAFGRGDYEQQPGRSSGHTLRALAQHLPHLTPGIEGLVATLVSLGLATADADLKKAIKEGLNASVRPSGIGHVDYAVRVKATDLGRSVLEQVREAHLGDSATD